MILVKPSFEIWAAYGHEHLPYSYSRAHELIEAAARVCYKSEGKKWTVCPQCNGWGKVADPELIKRCDVPENESWMPCPVCNGGNHPNSADKMVAMLRDKGHHAMLEHSWVVIDYPHTYFDSSAFLNYGMWPERIAGNMRAFEEAGIDRPYGMPFSGFGTGGLPPTETTHLKAMTVKFICDRGVSHELVRHRPASYAQESTRYCNYGGGVTFVIPPWLVDVEPGTYKEYIASSEDPTNTWLNVAWNLEQSYLDLLSQGWQPQQARSVLPNSLKTEIVMTASLAEWRHVFKLRCDKRAHPQMRELMLPLRDAARELYPGVFGE